MTLLTSDKQSNGRRIEVVSAAWTFCRTSTCSAAFVR